MKIVNDTIVDFKIDIIPSLIGLKYELSKKIMLSYIFKTLKHINNENETNGIKVPLQRYSL